MDLRIDIPDKLNVENFQVYHGQGLIIHKDVIIGKNVINSTTLL